MAVVIRMKRTGRRNRPCYRISVADRSFPRDGRTLDNLGVYDPASPVKELQLKVDAEGVKRWIANGAVPSQTVYSLLRREGLVEPKPFNPRKRKRSATTATHKRRVERSKAREERKTARRDERTAAKRAAAAAAKAAAAAEGSEES